MIKWQRKINGLQIILESVHWSRQGRVILWMQRRIEMKIYYYTFTPEGKVIKDNLTVRKNKYSYVIGAGFYGGMEHRCPKNYIRKMRM